MPNNFTAANRTTRDIEREMEDNVFALLGSIEFYATHNYRDSDRERLLSIAELLRGFFAKREKLKWELIATLGSRADSGQPPPPHCLSLRCLTINYIQCLVCVRCTTKNQ
ncbi:MAG: hypothetical protein JW841_13985 [Deltaproteobacteria bacterium]|nr:hypothetical protein [Deltaproteobacteria bacterium]